MADETVWISRVDRSVIGGGALEEFSVLTFGQFRQWEGRRGRFKSGKLLAPTGLHRQLHQPPLTYSICIILTILTHITLDHPPSPTPFSLPSSSPLFIVLILITLERDEFDE
jgi:hypothetical protein